MNNILIQYACFCTMFIKQLCQVYNSILTVILTKPSIKARLQIITQAHNKCFYLMQHLQSYKKMLRYKEKCSSYVCTKEACTICNSI